MTILLTICWLCLILSSINLYFARKYLKQVQEVYSEFREKQKELRDQLGLR